MRRAASFSFRFRRDRARVYGIPMPVISLDRWEIARSSCCFFTRITIILIDREKVLNLDRFDIERSFPFSNPPSTNFGIIFNESIEGKCIFRR